MTSANRRRWLPRYSLRTLFIVLTVIGCWLGYELSWIRQRQKARQWLERAGGCYVELFALQQHPAPTIPFWRTWLGDQAVTAIVIPSNTWGATRGYGIERLRQLFPETTVCDREAMHLP